jgi:hypothetical protein
VCLIERLMVKYIVGNLKGNIPWNKGKTKENDQGVRKTSETMKLRHIDNFAKWRMEAKLSGVIPESSKKLEKSDDLAFLIGLILGDGNIHKFPRTECLRITLGTDKPKLALFVINIMKNVLKKTPSMRKGNDSNCFNIDFYQKNLSFRLGVPSGSRGKLEIKLPTWIWTKERYLLSALRGLFEAEASYCVHEKTYTYNFEFSNKNSSLLDEVEKGLIILGYHPERRINAVRLRKKAEAVGFRDQIRFRTYP